MGIRAKLILASTCVALVGMFALSSATAQSTETPSADTDASASELVETPPPVRLQEDFDAKPYEKFAVREQYASEQQDRRRKPNQGRDGGKDPKWESDRKPEIKDSVMMLADGGGNWDSSLAFDRKASGRHRKISASFSFSMGGGAHGFCFALLNTSRFGARGPAFELYRNRKLDGTPGEAPKWDEPNLWGSFALGFDGHNPPTDDPFNEWGNVHKQPQHEISLHYDGREVANRFSSVDFTTGSDFSAQVEVDYVTGGAEITVKVNGQSIYERYFLAHMATYESRVAFGCRAEARDAKVSVDDIDVLWQEPCGVDPSPMCMKSFQSEWFVKGKDVGLNKRETFSLLPKGIDCERVIMTVRLLPMVVRDEWDRYGSIGIVGPDGERWEMARLLTPFMIWGETYEWEVDVTPFKDWLVGDVTLDAHIGANVGRGFALDLDFTYYRRPEGVKPLPKVLGLGRLWHQRMVFAKKKRDTFPAPIELTPPAGTKRVEFRTCVTGHGAKLEFSPSDRVLRVNGKEYPNTLWTTDPYLNPYRPQGGTWKYARAGWGPGTIGDVWVENYQMLDSDKKLKVEYIPEDKTYPGGNNHQLAAYAVFYAE